MLQLLLGGLAPLVWRGGLQACLHDATSTTSTTSATSATSTTSATSATSTTSSTTIDADTVADTDTVTYTCTHAYTFLACSHVHMHACQASSTNGH